MVNDIEDLLARFRAAHEALHRCWTKATGTADYDKSDFRLVDNELARAFRAEARALGYDGPLMSGER